MINQETFSIGIKTAGTICAVHLTPFIAPEQLPALIEGVIQLIVAIGGLIAMFKRKKK